MKLNTYTIRRISYLIWIVILFSILSCNSRGDEGIRKGAANSSKSDTLSTQVIYSPLTYDKYVAIISGNEHFSDFLLTYGKTIPNVVTSFFDIGGATSPGWDAPIDSVWDAPINTISEYSGVMIEWLITSNPPFEDVNHYRYVFTQSEFEAILNYLNNNSDYFFNNVEYDGNYPPPVESLGGSLPLCSGNYTFSLMFGEPGDINNLNYWAIHKCVDEYPVPDHPLYGLFQLLEDDFISKLEPYEPDIY